MLSRGPGGASGCERHEGSLWGWTHPILVVMATPVFPDAATGGTGSVRRPLCIFSYNCTSLR